MNDSTTIWVQILHFKLKKENCFGPIRSLFSFSTAQTEKNSWFLFRETNWWKHLMNSLIVNGAQFCQDSDDESNQEKSQYLYPCAVGILVLTTYNCLMEFVQLYRVWVAIIKITILFSIWILPLISFRIDIDTFNGLTWLTGLFTFWHFYWSLTFKVDRWILERLR